MRIKIILIGLFLTFGTHSKSQLFTLMPKEVSGIDFQNKVIESQHLNIFNYEYLFNGAGVAIGDINNDGLNDIFFAGNMMSNKLYLNRGNLKFDDISPTANTDKGDGINTGVSMMDINGDGWLDIYVCKSGLNDPKYRNHNVYINNKDNTFSDKAKEMGLLDSSFSTQAYFYDMDNDGDLDLYLLNHPYKMGESKKIILTYNKQGKLEVAKPESYKYYTDRYFENNNGKFIDRTVKAGFQNYAFGLSAVIADFNHDNYADIYVANDYTQPDVLYINNKNGTFTEKSDSFFQHFSYNSMGTDYADIDNNGYDDLITLDMLPEENYRQKQFRQQIGYDQYGKLVKYGFKSQFVKNCVQLNKKGKKYSDVGYSVDMSLTDWSWAPMIADYDNNGHKDIYITNGYYHDFTDQDFTKYKLDSIVKAANKEVDLEKLKEIMSNIPSVKVNNYFFTNQGNMKFVKNPPNTGLDIPSFSNGGAYGDLDNDGDLELVVSNINQDAFIFRNNARENNSGNYLRLKLISTKNPNLVYGAKINILTQDSMTQFYRFYPVKGFMSSHEHFVHIGLGKNIDALITITLANGTKLNPVIKQANQIALINIDEMQLETNITDIKQPNIDFKDITKACRISHTGIENEYIDFKQEPLIPRQYSRSGPAIAVGDINGDKLEDMYIGGAKDEEGFFYIQQVDGSFIKKMSPAFTKDKLYEDGAAKFLDFDKDGDQDLIVTCGGNDYPNELVKYPVRLYINQGGSNYTRAGIDVFPNIYTSSKTIAIDDYNKDGFDDIFIGGNILPGHYGRIPNSFLLKNSGRKFELDPFSIKNEKLTMINDAIWLDIDQNGYKELITVGEWTPPIIYRNSAGNIENKNESIGNVRGWWTSITASDLNLDGVQDLILGNYGTNTRYIGTALQPMTMYVNDYDKNGSTDAIINTFIQGKSYPLAQRDVLLDQLPFLKKRFNRYDKYSRAVSADVFTADEQIGTDTMIANFMQSVILYLKPNGSMDMKLLPFDAQVFPVNAVLPIDADQDGVQDLLLAGNDFGLEIETGRLDAGQGLILRKNKSTSYRPIYNHNLDLSGDVKSLTPITIAGKKAIIVGRNSAALQILALPE
jgi:enediyne biosynthesis protein E4